MINMRLIPRKSGQFVISSLDFAHEVRTALESATDVLFPSLKDGAETLEIRRSAPIGSFKVSSKVQKFLASKGVIFSTIRDRSRRGNRRRWRNYLIMDIDNARWHQQEWDNPTREIRFDICWSAADSGIIIHLQAFPFASNGSVREDTLLASHMREFGVEFPELFKKLIDTSGRGFLSWDDLDMEPCLSLEKVFANFAYSFPHLSKAKYFLVHLAKEEKLKLFDPCPLFWDNNIFTGQRSNRNAEGYVPQSAQKELHEHWLEQVYQFTDKIPTRPK